MSDESNVVGIHGYEPPLQPGEAIPEIVEKLEEILEAARNGEIVGVAIAFVSDDRTGDLKTGGAYRYPLTRVMNCHYALEAAMARVGRMLSRDLDARYGDV